LERNSRFFSSAKQAEFQTEMPSVPSCSIFRGIICCQKMAALVWSAHYYRFRNINTHKYPAFRNFIPPVHIAYSWKTSVGLYGLQADYILGRCENGKRNSEKLYFPLRLRRGAARIL
jgi:hypothetical protein